MNFWDFQAREFPIPRVLLDGIKSSGNHPKEFVSHMNNIPTTEYSYLAQATALALGHTWQSASAVSTW